MIPADPDTAEHDTGEHDTGEHDTGDAWRLSPRAQQRLTMLAAARRPGPAERMAYLSHHCADCGGRKLTWLHAGEYLCEDCWQCRTAKSKTTAPPPEARPRSRRILHSRRRSA